VSVSPPLGAISLIQRTAEEGAACTCDVGSRARMVVMRTRINEIFRNIWFPPIVSHALHEVQGCAQCLDYSPPGPFACAHHFDFEAAPCYVNGAKIKFCLSIGEIKGGSP
jgi:hypothetical protein